MPSSPSKPESKTQNLRRRGALHPAPAKVRDDLFLTNDFFDPRDLVQVKYEMVRRVEKDDWPVSKAAATFGLSRPAYYAAQAALDKEGLAGLIPKKRGRRTAHKLTDEAMDFIVQLRASDPGLTTSDVIERVKERFGTVVHRRSVERAMTRRGNAKR